MAEEAERVRSEATREAYVQIADNGELAAILVKEREGQDLTAVEALRLDSLFLRGLIGYQTSFN